MTSLVNDQNNVYVTCYVLIPIISFIIIISSYYTLHIYKTFTLIKIIENEQKTKLIYIKDINTRVIDKLLMLVFNNIIVSINDNNKLRQLLQNNSDKKISIIIKSTGGYVSSSDSMLNLLDNHKANKNIYVPSYAMSAATLLVFACNNIYMNNYAVVGPTDPQLSLFNDMVSFKAVYKLIENKSIDKIKDKILINYYENKILYDDNIKIITKYINKHKKKNATQHDIDELIKMFSYGDIAHHTEINSRVLNKVFNINYVVPDDIMQIYNQMNYVFEII
jgi:hypothetical protein